MEIDLNQAIQKRAMAEQMTNTFIAHTAAAIYAALLGRLEDGEYEVEDLRHFAQQARMAAPYLAEAFGLCKVNEKEDKP